MMQLYAVFSFHWLTLDNYYFLMGDSVVYRFATCYQLRRPRRSCLPGCHLLSTGYQLAATCYQLLGLLNLTQNKLSEPQRGNTMELRHL